MEGVIFGVFRRWFFLLLLGSAFSLQAQIGGFGKQQDPNDLNNNNSQNQNTPDKKNDPKEYTGQGSSIVDDSTKNIYGPKTSKWITESEIFYNRKDYKLLDTSVIDMHRWTYVHRFNYLYQDLGNMGTALNPIFPTVSSFTGVHTGFNAYRLYYDTEEPIYFDTKSAYSTFYLIWSGKGRASTKAKFSRNINPRWNFGFDYRSILVDRQVQRQRKGDRQVVSQYYDIYTSYFSKNKKYALIASFRRFRHLVEESGGLSGGDTLSFEGYFQGDKNHNMLQTAQTEEFRRVYHFWQQYTLAKGFQIYQSADFEKTAHYFRDKRGAETNYNKFFKQTIITPGLDSMVVTDKVVMNSSPVETGVKGNLAFLFYNFFHRIRRYQFQSASLADYEIGNSYWGTENTVGGRINLRLDTLTSLKGSAEYLLFGSYSLNAQFDSKWLDAKALSVLAKPGFMPQYYKGTHDFWVQRLNNTFSNQLEGTLKFDRPFLSLRAGMSYTTFSKRIYFAMEPGGGKKEPGGKKQQPDLIRPYQSRGTQQYLSPKAELSLPLGKKLKLRGQAIYSKITANSDQVLQMPKLFANGQFCYEHWMFKKAIFVQAGADVHWQSAYYAYAYMPTIQQFYRQTTLELPAFTMLDLFINGEFKGGRFFLKWHNVLQTKYLSMSKYIPTPTYRGMGSVLDFGFDLRLFD